jgi:uncharacterized protein (DUF3084 family)
MKLLVSNLKDDIASISSENECLKSEIAKRDFHAQELEREINKLKNKIVENDNMILHRNTEEIKRLNQEIKTIETNREFEESRLKTLVKTYEMKVDQLTKESFSTNEKLL